MWVFFKGDELVRADSELEESEDSEPEEVEVEDFSLSKVEVMPGPPQSQTPAGPPLASENKSNQQLPTRSVEEVLILWQPMKCQSWAAY